MKSLILLLFGCSLEHDIPTIASVYSCKVTMASHGKIVWESQVTLCEEEDFTGEIEEQCAEWNSSPGGGNIDPPWSCFGDCVKDRLNFCFR